MRFVVPTALAVVLVVPGGAFAHKMDVAVAIPETALDVVRVVAKYDDDNPADGAKVTLTDGAGAATATGTTDADGVCVLPRPRAGAYTVTVDDGGGHRTGVPLRVPESEREAAEARSAGRNRWVMTGVGLAVIAAGTALVRALRRKAG